MNLLKVIIVVVFACQGHSQGNSQNREKIKMVFSLDGPPSNFINEEGKLDGQSVQLVAEVCRRANKDCELTYTTDRTRCWNGATNRSEILDIGEALVCANLVESPARNENYMFAEQSIFRLPPSALIRPLTATDDDISVEKLKECNDFKIAYPANTALTRDCLLNAGLYIKEENAIGVSITGSIVVGQSNLVDLVLNGTADAGLVIPRLLFRDDIKIFGTILCTDVLMGLNMMVRKNDSEAQEFLDWWNKTLTELICDGSLRRGSSSSAKRSKSRCPYFDNDYDAICAKLFNDFSTDPLCFTPGVDVSCPGKPMPSTTPPPPPVPVC